MKPTALLLFAAIVLSPPACAEPLQGFTYTAKTDLFGYYIPAHPVRCGAYKLITIDLSVPDDFRMFAQDPHAPGQVSPIGLNFAPAGARQRPGSGGVLWEGSFQVQPTAYRVTEGTMTLTADDRRLGPLTFNGTIDMAALTALHKGTSGDFKRIVMRGDLVVGTCARRNIAFTWLLGD